MERRSFLACPACIEGWIEVTSDTHGHYWRRCVCWHEAQIADRVALGVPGRLARIRQAREARMYEPLGLR